MSKPVIVYFPARGRAELARFVLAAAGQDWDERLLNPETLVELKGTGKLAFGQVPLLEDGDLNIVQSGAIARYLARKHDLFGDLQDGVIADQIIDGHNDFLTKLIPALYPQFNKEKAVEVGTTVLPGFLKAFESILERNNGGNGFVSGDKLTLGDLALYLISESYFFDHAFASADDYPKLKAHKERIGAIPNIAAFISSEKRHPVRKFE